VSQPAGTERPPPARGGGGNLLMRKYGGVPGWGWVVIVSGIAGAVIWYVQRKKGSAAAAASSATPQGPTQATCYDANGATVACSDPLAVGSNATDYFEALYAQSQGINSQLQNIAPQVTETGQDADAIQALLKNLPGSDSEPTVGHIPGEPGPVPHGPGPLVTLPNVVGQRANFAIGDLRTGVGVNAVTSPARDPRKEYIVTSMTPHAGSRVRKGSTVTLGIKAVSRAQAARLPATFTPGKAA
jgi:hypothetical protein